MPGYLHIIWDAEDDPRGNVQHLAEHGLTMNDVEYVPASPTSESTSHTTGRAVCFGYPPGGIYVIVVYERVDPDTLFVVTFYEVPEP